MMMSSVTTLQVRVAKKQVEAVDICSFELVDLENRPLPIFSAGSHIDIQLPGGLTRQYSICNDPDQNDRYLVAVLKDGASRGGSIAMHDKVSAGDILTISTPKNHFPLVQKAKRSLLFAGGIGITPILSMAKYLARLGENFDLHYSSRSIERTAFLNDLQQSNFAATTHFHFDSGSPENALNLAALLAVPQQGVHVYVCGPKGFIEAVLSAARTHGWPPSQLHHEFFGAEVKSNKDQAGFEVQLASSGRIIPVSNGQTVVEALEAAGISIETSCAQGVCGTCLTRVIEGEPDHRDIYLTPDEQAANKQFLPCCSRSKSRRLVLDL
jgi:vanillate monooxygenase ferredoxin subunit